MEYKLAPEKPGPWTGDCVTAYRELIKTVPASKVVFMGDSAGGGLVLLVTQQLVASKVDVPKAAVAISPW